MSAILRACFILPCVILLSSCSTQAGGNATVEEPGRSMQAIQEVWAREQALIRELGLDKRISHHAPVEYERDIPEWVPQDVAKDNEVFFDRVVKIDAGGFRWKDADFAKLSGFERLRDIWLFDSGISDVTIKHLANIPTLTRIRLNGTNIRGKHLDSLSRLKHLHTLDLAGCPLDADSWRKLGTLNTVQDLNLRDTTTTDVNLEYVVKGLDLQSLNLSSTRITDEGVKLLIGETRLKSLGLGGTRITDDAIMDLMEFRGLEVLILSGCDIHPSALEQLRKALPETEVVPSKKDEKRRGD